VITNISGRSNTIIKTRTGFSYDINDVFYATLSLNFDYETEPADDAEKEDLALLLGLGAEF
jgi:putative salt-induced outer membrane protein YdiY